MSIAEATIHADLTRELRADLAATRNALQRAQEAGQAKDRQIERLQKAVRALAALNAWHHFGDCRAWGTGPIISPHDADELARRVLRA